MANDLEQVDTPALEARLAELNQQVSQPPAQQGTGLEQEDTAVLEARLAELSQQASNPAPTPGLVPGQVQPAEQAQEQPLSEEDKLRRNPEATLGFSDRLKFSIEPIQSNRRQFLVQKFGEQNVFETKGGDLFIRQDNTFKPVNQEGISVADLAEIAGSLPESVGAVAGGLLGAGPATIPGAIAGGALGSVARQATSAALGVPQVEPIVSGERATEVAISGAVSGVFGALGKLVKGSAKFFTPGASSKGKQLARIAKEQNIPAPTLGQLAGDPVLKSEKILAEIPLTGRAVRKQIKSQQEAVRENLVKETGKDFIEVSDDLFESGEKAKQMLTDTVEGITEGSKALFNEVEEITQKTLIDPAVARKEFLNSIKGFRVLGPDGTQLKYSPTTGLTKDGFDQLSGVLKGIDDAFKEGIRPEDIAELGLDESAIGKINIKALNAIRKTVDDSVDFLAPKQKDTVLMQVSNKLQASTENTLKSVDKEAAAKFKEARSLWGLRIKNINRLKSLGVNIKEPEKSLGSEKILKKIYSDTKNMNAFREVVGEETFKETSENFIFNFLQQRSTKGVKPGRILNDINRRQKVFEEALGKERLNRIKDNLTFLEEVNKPVNASQSGITTLLSDVLREVKGAALRAGIATRQKGVEAIGKVVTPVGVALTQEEQTKAARKKALEPRR